MIKKLIILILIILLVFSSGCSIVEKVTKSGSDETGVVDVGEEGPREPNNLEINFTTGLE